MTIHELHIPKSREESLSEVRSINIANALYMATSHAEVLEGLRPVHPDNLAAMIEMIEEILAEYHGGDCA